MNNYGSISVSQNIPPGGGGGSAYAENGLSFDSSSGDTYVFLGNDENDPSSPAGLYSNREIATNDFYLKFLTLLNNMCAIWMTDMQFNYNPETQVTIEGSITTKRMRVSEQSGYNIEAHKNSNWLFVAIGGVE